MPTKFRIARGTDARIQGLSKNEGQVYFATDTGKIYYDVNSTERIVMGASGVAIHYGKAPADLEPDPDYSTGKFFLLSIQDDLENPDELIAIEDLIFNDDGTFYKVWDKDETTLYCQKLAVAGGGGGGSGGVSTAKVIDIKIETPDNINLINEQAASIAFTATSAIETDGSIMDDKLTISWSLAVKQGNSYITYHNGTSFMVSHGQRYVLSFGEYLRPSATSKISIQARGTNSGESRIKEQEFTTSELILTRASTFSNMKVYDTNNVTIQCNAIGNMNKILDYYFDDILIKSDLLGPSSAAAQSYTVPTVFNGKTICTHGWHSIRVELYQAVETEAGSGEWERRLSAEPIALEVAIKDGVSVKPIIWLGEYKDKYYNYDDIRIPFLVYDPNAGESTTVYLWKNGLPTSSPEREVPASQYSQFNMFEITDAELDIMNYYSISCGLGDNKEERPIQFFVEQDPNRSMEIVKKDYLRLLFDAKGRSNAESVSNRASWNYTNELHGINVNAKFNNFNWYNNGWKEDEEGNTCLRISNGAEFILPIGSTTFNGGTAATQSWTYEMQFKIKNIQDYTELIQNITRYKEDAKYYEAFTAETQKTYTNYDAFLAWYLPLYGEGKSYDDLEFDYVYKKINLSKVACGYYSGNQSNATGFCFGSQDAFFSNGTNTVSVSYVEDEMIYLTMVYSYEDKRIYIYINGMLTGAINSTLGNNPFTVLKEEGEGIRFNSEYCDIDLYKFRIYNTPLNVYDVVMNHAVDLKDIDIYDLCEIAEENSSINEFQLKLGSETENGVMKYNANNPHKYIMPYIIFDATGTDANELSWSKDVDLPIRVTFKNTGLDYAYSSGALEELAIADGLCTINSTPEEKAAAVKKYYLHHCPSFTGNNINMAVQGTSSEFYPRRNYKLKFKTNYDNPDKDDVVHFWLNAGPYEDDYLTHGETRNVEEVKDKETEAIITPEYVNPCHTEWFYMNNYDVGTTKFTMKIDFMESSGSYNGGFCRLVHNAYSKHPLDDYKKAGAFKDPKGKLPDTKSLRTNTDGYPVLAFHKKGDNQYQYIGRYNMLLDKGSDEAYGFKVDKSITANFVKDKAVRKIAECWEFSDNSRTFCSFRDPEERKELSFMCPPRTGNPKDKEAGYKTNAVGSAPIVCDSFEYRYHDGGDVMDYIYDPTKNADKKGDALEAYPTPGTIIDGVETDNTLDIVDSLPDRGTIISKYYKNWEKLCQWVWSTCVDHVPNQGTPTEKTDLGQYAWSFGQFYLLQEGKSGESDNDYVKDSASAFDPEASYYLKQEGKWNRVSVNLVEYESNTYYINVNGNYVLSPDAFDSAQTYYVIEVDEDMLATSADRLVRQCTEEDAYDAETKYYTYNPAAKNNKAVVWVAGLTQEAFDLEKTKYYIGIEKRYGKNLHKYDTKEYRNDKFKAELKDHFDIEYLSTYFVMTEIFECYDSRGKNCMMASWGPLKADGEYIWYPIFYDLDTQLGINNTGIPSFTYSVDASEAGNYSTSDSVLWNNFYANYKSTYILQKYKQLRGETSIDPDVGGSLAPGKAFLHNVDKIEKWYSADPDECGWKCKSDTNVRAKNYAMTGQRPLIALNLDEYYKFLTIYNARGTDPSNKALYGQTGRIDGSGKFVVESTDYLYALQGDRSLSRRQFLTNRIAYLDSWLNVGNFARGGAQRLWGRVQANNTNIVDQWIEPRDGAYWQDDNKTIKTHEFDAEYWMTVTPIHDSYVTFGGDNENWPSKKFSGTPLKFNIDSIEQGFRTSDNYKEQLLYIYGIDQMRDLGDLSKMYWTEFKIEGDAKKLTRLKLGHDAYMTDSENNLVYDDNGNKIGWFNNKMNPPSFSASGLPLLKEMNFCNIRINESAGGTPALDLSKSEKLENFRATGSNLTDVMFARGVALNTLYLPATVTKLDLTEARLLNTVIEEYEIPTKNASGEIEAKPGLFIEKLTNLDENSTDITNVTYFSITGDYFGYDSYKLMSKYYKNRLKDTANRTTIKLTDVKWSPYVQLIEGDKYDKTKTYKKDNGHYGLVDYQYDVTTFDYDVANGEIYYLDTSYTEDQINSITNIDMLNDFIDKALLIGVGENSTVPELTGIMYVKNTEATAVDELTIKNKIVKNFPKLNIFFEHVIPATSGKFILPDFDDDGNYLGTYSYVSDGETTELSIQKIPADGWFENPYTKYKPDKPNYDFLGWSSTKDKSGLISSVKETAEQQAAAWAAHRPEVLELDYTFYALFEKHEYNMEFFNNGTPFDNFPIKYGETLKKSDKLPSYSDSSLGLEETYRFIGWTENANVMIVSSEKEVKIVDFNMLRSVKDYKFYACYMKENVHKNATDLSLFRIDTYTQGTYGSGLRIRPQVGITLSGKITLPTHYNKEPIKYIEGFQNQDQLTHVFWVDDKENSGGPQLLQVRGGMADAATFSNCTSLVYFEMPSTVRSIGSYAFQGCPLEYNIINSGCESIGGSAFQGSFSKDFKEIKIPGSVKTIDDFAFSYLNCAADCVILGDVGDPTQLTTISGPDAFCQNGGNEITKIRYYSNSIPNTALEGVLDQLRANGDDNVPIYYEPMQA